MVVIALIRAAFQVATESAEQAAAETSVAFLTGLSFSVFCAVSCLSATADVILFVWACLLTSSLKKKPSAEAVEKATFEKGAVAREVSLVELKLMQM